MRERDDKEQDKVEWEGNERDEVKQDENDGMERNEIGMTGIGQNKTKIMHILNFI